MTAPASRVGQTVMSRPSSYAWATTKALSLAEKLDNRQEEVQRAGEQADKLERLSNRTVPRQNIMKSFSFHIGADLQIPTDDKTATHVVDTPASSAHTVDPFEGLPLRAWAERMGERIMPAYDLIKEEQKKAKLAAKKTPTKEAAIPNIPHLLPFTRWASRSSEFRDTFIADDPKTRKRARLSWYHPDDTMVPRNWFSGGLLEDLKYYAPFKRSTSTPSTQNNDVKT